VKAVVMVEGPSDEALLRLLLRHMGLEAQCQIVKYAETPEGFISIIRTQLNNPNARLVLVRDLDEMSEAEKIAETEKSL